ncbi:hypothetical protein [Hymenobacter sp. B81]|uniref:hypothetical protein n=1 Tax=Hymenobacter sp. B81 TaxID=3344878 RepID=UPI0037DC112D
MKLPTIITLLGTLLWLPSAATQAQSREASEKITRELTLTADAGRSTLAVYNLFGSVSVQGYSGSKVLVEITKTIRARNAADLAQGQKEAQPGFEQRGDSVVLYLQGPHDTRPRRQRNSGNHQLDYEFSFDYVVKVPAGMQVDASTVNGGSVRVQDVTGLVKARNVNGPVAIVNAREATVARTVNGDVSVSYAAVPRQASTYHTINGDITVSYPAGVAADVYFKSLHGELFTDFPQAEVLPARVSQNEERGSAGTKYKLSKETAVRLGKGGTDFRFETLNGNVTIKQLSR